MPEKISPLFKEPVIVPVPVADVVRIALLPEQTNVGPLSVAVGLLVNVITVVAVS